MMPSCASAPRRTAAAREPRGRRGGGRLGTRHAARSFWPLLEDFVTVTGYKALGPSPEHGAAGTSRRITPKAIRRSHTNATIMVLRGPGLASLTYRRELRLKGETAPQTTNTDAPSVVAVNEPVARPYARTI
jgi:hypothetical protein